MQGAPSHLPNVLIRAGGFILLPSWMSGTFSRSKALSSFTSPRRFARWVAACGRRESPSSGCAVSAAAPASALGGGGGRGGCPPTSKSLWLLQLCASPSPSLLSMCHQACKIMPPAPLVASPLLSACSTGNRPGRLPLGCQDSRGRQKHRWGTETSLTPGPRPRPRRKDLGRAVGSQVVTHPLPTGPGFDSETVP